MSNRKYIYSTLLMLPALLFFSCQEDVPGLGGGADDGAIVLRVSMPDADSRSSSTTVTSSLNDGFRVSAICPEDDAKADNLLDTFFTDLSVSRLDNQHFAIFDQSGIQCVWPTIRHGKDGKLKFFAFYPSFQDMRASAGVGEGYFGLKNNSKKVGDNVTYDYRIEKFRISNDITRHIDFVTATTEGSRKDNETSGVTLNFEHQLSGVSFKVWGNLDSTEIKEIEIAGVRIGRAITQSDFNFAANPKFLANGDATRSGDWVGTQVKDSVEDIFRIFQPLVMKDF